VYMTLGFWQYWPLLVLLVVIFTLDFQCLDKKAVSGLPVLPSNFDNNEDILTICWRKDNQTNVKFYFYIFATYLVSEKIYVKNLDRTIRSTYL